MRRRLPDVIGIGPAHGGTTWLYRDLKARIGMPLPKKETHFFDQHYEKRINWYADRCNIENFASSDTRCESRNHL
jgi:hypothetical protein